MKTNVKIIVAAMCTAGLISPSLALADVITPVTPPGTLAPQAQTPIPPANTLTTFPVIVNVPGTANPTLLNLQYNSTTNTWNTNNAAWAFDSSVNAGQNTAVFTTTTANGTVYSFALSNGSPGNNPPFGPATGTPAVVTPPSVGVNYTAPLPQPTVASSLLGAATASGQITGLGRTVAPLVGPLFSVAPVGSNPPGTPPLVATIGGTSSSSASSGTSQPGSAGGAVTVTANNANQSISFGTYTSTFPTTPTPVGTTTINGTVAGSSGAVGAAGIFLNSISGTATYNTGTGVINTTATATPTFSVTPNGNTFVGGSLIVAGASKTNGILDTGGIGTFGNLSVGGHTATSGLSNTGLTTTDTLIVTQGSSTHGIVNAGNIATGSLTVLGDSALNGNINVGGKVTTNGIANNGLMTTGGLIATGGIGAATLGVTGNATIGGTLISTGVVNTGNITSSGNATVGGTLGVTGATTLGGAGTSGNQLTVSVNGVLMSAGATSGNSVGVNSSGAQINGGGAALVLANNRATFGATNGSGPIQVTGIADGQNQYDAVNFGQLDKLKKDGSRGISGVAAMSNIPQVDQNKNFSLGVGVGGFDGETAFAIGGSARVWKDGIIKASVGFAGGGGSNTTWGVGGGWNW